MSLSLSGLMDYVTPYGFPWGSDGKESAHNAGDSDLIPRLGRPLGEGNGHPLQYSCLENPMDRGAWRAAVHGVTDSWTRLHFHFQVLQEISLRNPTRVGTLPCFVLPLGCLAWWNIP